MEPAVQWPTPQHPITPLVLMSDILTKAVVLVLNRNWQAINVRTPQEAFCMMATNVATGLEIEGEEHIRPVTWEEWIRLPIRDLDEAVRTVRGPIRVPTVIVAVNSGGMGKWGIGVLWRWDNGTMGCWLLRCHFQCITPIPQTPIPPSPSASTTLCPARVAARTRGKTWCGRARQ